MSRNELIKAKNDIENAESILKSIGMKIDFMPLMILS